MNRNKRARILQETPRPISPSSRQREGIWARHLQEGYPNYHLSKFQLEKISFEGANRGLKAILVHSAFWRARRYEWSIFFEDCQPDAHTRNDSLNERKALLARMNTIQERFNQIMVIPRILNFEAHDNRIYMLWKLLYTALQMKLSVFLDLKDPCVTFGTFQIGPWT